MALTKIITVNLPKRPNFGVSILAADLAILIAITPIQPPLWSHFAVS
jgi:hypothetical protein